MIFIWMWYWEQEDQKDLIYHEISSFPNSKNIRLDIYKEKTSFPIYTFQKILNYIAFQCFFTTLYQWGHSFPTSFYSSKTFRVILGLQNTLKQVFDTGNKNGVKYEIKHKMTNLPNVTPQFFEFMKIDVCQPWYNLSSNFIMNYSVLHELLQFLQSFFPIFQNFYQLKKKNVSINNRCRGCTVSTGSSFS